MEANATNMVEHLTFWMVYCRESLGDIGSTVENIVELSRYGVRNG